MLKSDRSSKSQVAIAGSASRLPSVRVEYTPPPSRSRPSIFMEAPTRTVNRPYSLERLRSAQPKDRAPADSTEIALNPASSLLIEPPALPSGSTLSAASIGTRPSPSTSSGLESKKRAPTAEELKRIGGAVWQSEVVSAAIRSRPIASKTESSQTTGQDGSSLSDKYSRGALYYLSRIINSNLVVLLEHFIFEPNDGITRLNIEMVISSYMSALTQLGCIKDWNVICDESNNPPNNQYMISVDVAIKPSHSTEFVYLPVKITLCPSTTKPT